MAPWGVGAVCSANAASGLGKRVNRPSASMALAPDTISSAGWPMNISVPFHWSLSATSVRAVPSQLAMWMSWPQLCVTKLSRPPQSVRAWLA